MSARAILLCGTLLLWSASVSAQVTQTLVTLEAHIVQAEAVFRGPITQLETEVIVPPGGMKDNCIWPDGIVIHTLTIRVKESYKGAVNGTMELRRQTSSFDGRWQEWQGVKTDFLWFASPAKEGEEGNAGEQWSALRIGEPVSGEKTYRTSSLPMFAMDLSVIRTPEELLNRVKAFTQQPGEKTSLQTITLPHRVVKRCCAAADANSLVLPVVPALEQIAHRMLNSPEEFAEEQKLDPFTEFGLRRAGVECLQHFPSPENIQLLTELLQDPTVVQVVTPQDECGKPSLKEYPLRILAYDILRVWGRNPKKPVLQEPITPEELERNL